MTDLSGKKTEKIKKSSNIKDNVNSDTNNYTASKAVASSVPDSGNIISEREFWNKRSKGFPRYSAEANSYEANILAKINDAGVDFTGMSVLDIGCGNGMYTLGIAHKARHVTALDIAEKMLQTLNEDAARFGLNNILTVRADWLDFELSDHQKDDIDIILTAMTPALKSDEGKEKVLEISAKQRVYIAYAGAQRSDIFQPIFEKHNIERDHVNEAFDMVRWLNLRGLPYKSIIVEGEWHNRHRVEELRERYSTSLHRRGIIEDWEFFERQISKYTIGSEYHETTSYKVMIIIW